MNLVRHVKQHHANETNKDTVVSDDESEPLMIAADRDETHVQQQKHDYSFETNVRAPLILKNNHQSDRSLKGYADIRLSINIVLPKSNKSIAVCYFDRRKPETIIISWFC